MVPMTSQNCYLPQSGLTPWQAQTFLLFVIMMLADLAITVWGYLNVPGFVEANPLFARFIDTPILFMNTITWIKLTMIAGVLLMVQWFNRYESPGTKWHGGNIICGTATIGMAALLTILLSVNLLIIL